MGARDDDDLAGLGALRQPTSTSASRSRCFGAPYRVAAPAARTTGAAYRQPFSERQSRVTSSTYASEAAFGAPPAFSTAVGPAL